MTERIVAFVLGGGQGQRLWPLSRPDRPKQFHDLAGTGPMLAATLRRMKAREAGETALFVIGAERHAGRLLDAMAGVGLDGSGLILEPAPRNTAAAVAVAALHTLARFGDALVLVAPSDHEIATDRQFWETVEIGAAAAADRLVVFGVEPDRPETGYGYIEVGAALEGAHDVVRFVEKPDAETAASFLESGRFVWNSGLFLARAGVLIGLFERFRPDILEGARAALAQARADAAGSLRLSAEACLALSAQSFDRAVVERAEASVMVPARFAWHDIGSWRSLAELGPTDPRGNVIVGDVTAIDCRNSYLRSEGRLLTAIGLNDTAVVVTGDATLVAPLGRSQDVRSVVAGLQAAARSIPERRTGSAPDQPTSLRTKS